MKKKMELKLSVIISKERNWIVAKGIEIELASQGKSKKEALNNLKEAFRLWARNAETDELDVFKDSKPILTSVAIMA